MIGRKWLALGLAALANMAAYYTYDSIAPVARALHDLRGLTDTQIGLLNAVYSLPNIPLALVGGVVIDRLGALRAAVLASALCLAGAALTAFGEPFALMVGGRLVFGVGSETLYIALLCAIAGWFETDGALATALFFSLARVGSWLADTSPQWAGPIYAHGWQPPLVLATILCLVGLGAALACTPIAPRRSHAGERFEWAALRGFSRAFVAIALLNVLFAAVFFPFRSTFAIQYFQDARGLTLAQAGVANSWVFLAAILATPLFGLFADWRGHHGALLTGGAALMPVTFALLASDAAPLWVTTAMMGISFSVIPAVIWPATARLVEPTRLGTAFGLINMAQSLGLALSNLVAGALNDLAHAGPRHPQGYAGMFAWFIALSLAALAAAVKFESGVRHLPNKIK